MMHINNDNLYWGGIHNSKVILFENTHFNGNFANSQQTYYVDTPASHNDPSVQTMLYMAGEDLGAVLRYFNTGSSKYAFFIISLTDAGFDYARLLIERSDKETWHHSGHGGHLRGMCALSTDKLSLFTYEFWGTPMNSGTWRSVRTVAGPEPFEILHCGGK